MGTMNCGILDVGDVGHYDLLSWSEQSTLSCQLGTVLLLHVAIMEVLGIMRRFVTVVLAVLEGLLLLLLLGGDSGKGGSG
jgi:hypothetical protein